MKICILTIATNKYLQFVEELYDKEGSLFEDNFFTQLIRQLLTRVKNEENKPNVLIIEDLDRMDPDKRAAMIKQMRAVGLNP